MSPRLSVIEFAPETIHLWLLDPEQIDAALFFRLVDQLTPRERVRFERYLSLPKRREFALTRALVRRVLSQHAACEPRDWEFDTNSYGCPFVLRPTEHAQLRFNLSNTEGLIACAVCWASENFGSELGVDVEYTQRSGPTIAVARDFFAPSEVDELLQLDRELQPRRFFEIWTLKEAYIKARGKGLAIDLDAFAFSFDAFGQASISIDTTLHDSADNWVVKHFLCSPIHQLALAVRSKYQRLTLIQHDAAQLF